MIKTPKKSYLVGVIERAIAYYKVEAEDACTAAENWQDGEFHDRDDEALESDGPCNVRVKQLDGTWMKLPPSQWEAKPPSSAAADETEAGGMTAVPGEAALKPYSVLLLYPDYASEQYGTDTYYAFVTATDPIDAVAVAQRQAVAEQVIEIDDPADFSALLVTQGHNASEPLFNQ
jgi:hypothetical protein